eukprot:UN01882
MIKSTLKSKPIVENKIPKAIVHAMEKVKKEHAPYDRNFYEREGYFGSDDRFISICNYVQNQSLAIRDHLTAKIKSPGMTYVEAYCWCIRSWKAWEHVEWEVMEYGSLDDIADHEGKIKLWESILFYGKIILSGYD